MHEHVSTSVSQPGCSIQFESQYVALWGIYTMERDDDVLEYFDQPTRIQRAPGARRRRGIPQISLWCDAMEPDLKNGNPPPRSSNWGGVCQRGISAMAPAGGSVLLGRLQRTLLACTTACGLPQNIIRSTSKTSSFSRIFGPTRSLLTPGRKPRCSKHSRPILV